MTVESIDHLPPKEKAELEKELAEIRERFNKADQRKLLPPMKRGDGFKLRWHRWRR